MKRDIILSGVGGQGILSIAAVIGRAALEDGLHIKQAEVHGMSQRGGSVVTYVRYGDKVAEPIVEEGQADVLIAFERLEALRYAHFLKKDGVMIVNDLRMDPMPVSIGAAQYPENIIENLKKKHQVISLDAQALAKEIGNARVFNTIIIGVAAKRMDFAKEDWLKVIEETVPQKTIEINTRAFEAGYALG